jgi:adenine phosphoribosyltransferase
MGSTVHESDMSFRELFLQRFEWIGGHADILGLLADRALLAGATQALAAPFASAGITKVAAVEARGFVLGAAVAQELEAGFVAIRKAGAVHPGPKAVRRTAPDWRGNTTELLLQRAALDPSDRVLLVDDWIETGSQALASRALIEECGATYGGLSVLVDQAGPDARDALLPLAAVVAHDELPPHLAAGRAAVDDRDEAGWLDPQALIAPQEYARAAREQVARVLPDLADDARKVLDAAQVEARREDDNHVGTEHVVLGMFAVSGCLAARALADVGITRAVFVDHRHDEEGPSPAGRIPHTPRANRIIVRGGEIARANGAARVNSAHLLLGVVAESEEWGASDRVGVHHLRDAAGAVGTTLAHVRQAAEAQLGLGSPAPE